MIIPVSIITIAVFALELIFCFLEKEKERKIVKPFCIIMLMVLVATMKLDYIYVYGALFFGLIGDVFLIFKNRKMLFLLGAFSFFIGHLFYIFTFVNLLSFKIPEIVIVLVVALGLFTPLIPYKLCYAKTKAFTIPSAIYMYTLLLECVLAIILAIDTKSVYASFIGVGNILFLLSDILIFISIFIKDYKRRDFYIMLTYLIAQSFMSVGLVFLLR